MTDRRLFLDGRWEDGEAPAREIRSPFSGEPVARCAEASARQMERALAAADAAFKTFRKSSRFSRARLLAAIARRLEARREDLVAAIVAEAGKPRTLADAEVSRAVITFTTAAEEAKRLGGEVVPVDLDAAGRAYEPAVARWVPKGPVLAIAPFNFPLNLVAHKAAPALAVGATVIVKPPPQAPGAAVLLAEVFEAAAREVSDARETVPAAALQVLSAPNDVVARAVADPRIAILSFTGSDKVGWMLQEKAARKKVALELGGNAAVVVCEDADLPRAAARCAFGAFAYAGQVCISVQRVLVQKSAAPRFTELLLEETAKIKAGDPDKPEVAVGPLIDAAAADRVAAWIEEARLQGAKVLAGGKRVGNVIEPTVLSGVPPKAKLACEEAFGPVVVVDEYEKFDDALAAVNSSRFGLQAGLFTDSAERIRRAADELEVGGLMVNEVPTYRADNMPYGGVKDSGLGREGVRYAMEEYCERRVVVTWRGAAAAACLLLLAAATASAGLFGRDKLASVWASKPVPVNADDSDWNPSTAFESDGLSVQAMNDDQSLYLLVTAHTRDGMEQLDGVAKADVAVWFVAADGKTREWGARIPFSHREPLTTALKDPAGADPEPEYVFYEGAQVSSGTWPSDVSDRMAMSGRRPVWELKVPLSRVKQDKDRKVALDVAIGAAGGAAGRPRRRNTSPEEEAERGRKRRPSSPADSGPPEPLTLQLSVRLAQDPAKAPR